MTRLGNKVIIVTGAAGGIGSAIVERLCAEDARVIAVDRDETTVKQRCPRAAGHLQLDVSIEAQWTSAITHVQDKFGRLDALVNNAGINRSEGGEDPEQVLIADLHRLFAVNVDGVVLGCKHAIPAIARSGGGSIVNMSSIAALLPSTFVAAYAASKATVAQWTRTVALHCAQRSYGIRCNSVHPGQVLTPMMDELFERMGHAPGSSYAAAKQSLLSVIPMGKFQETVDIANAVLFLVSDESRYVTGTQILVDGGMSLAL
jgi:3(or 17)beta-hydroxysteroid dehydrogenase